MKNFEKIITSTKGENFFLPVSYLTALPTKNDSGETRKSKFYKHSGDCIEDKTKAGILIV